MTGIRKDPTPRTSHRGYDIVYGLNSDTWSCSRLDLEAATLSSLKGKIDRMIKKVNNENGVPVLYVGRYGGRENPTPALIIGTVTRSENIIDPKNRGRYIRADVPYLISMDARGGGNTTRHVTKLEDFILDTPENRAMLAEHERLVAAMVAARKKAEDYHDTIPRVTLDLFKGLTPDDDEGDA